MVDVVNHKAVMGIEAKEIISGNVKRLRANVGTTQTAFAEKAGLTRAVIANIERGELTSIDTLEQLANTYRVGLDYFVTVKEQGANPVDMVLDVNTMQQYDSEFKELPPKIQALSKLFAIEVMKVANERQLSESEISAVTKTNAQLLVDIARTETTDEAFKKSVMDMVTETTIGRR